MAPVTMTDDELRKVVDGEESDPLYPADGARGKVERFASPSDALRHGSGTLTVEDIDGDGQVRVSTEAIEQGALDLQLPLFEGHRFPVASIAFGGSLDFDIKDASDRALVEALKLGRRVIVRVFLHDDESGTRVAVDGQVTARSFAFKGKDSIPTTTAKVTIDGRRDEEE